MIQRVAILCGGRSSEHEISCISAGGVLAAMDRSKYQPVLIGITKDGKWVLIPEDHPMQIVGDVLPTVPTNAVAVVADVAGFSVQGANLNIDIVFPLLHGPYGEDGTIQGFLEIADLAYVGSGVLASAVAMDKSFAKPIFKACGIATAQGIVIRSSDWKTNQTALIVEIAALGFPLFIKPARGGSSRGTSKVKRKEEIVAAIAEAHKFDSKAIAEVAISGMEIECAVLEIDGKAQASIVGKIHIDSKFEFYDYQAKYLDGATRIELPAPIDSAIAKDIADSAVLAFTALGCSGLARVDFFLTEKNQIVINELNTMPGFTATSVFPKMWEASGIGFADLISHLLQNARTRSNSVLHN